MKLLYLFKIKMMINKLILLFKVLKFRILINIKMYDCQPIKILKHFMCLIQIHSMDLLVSSFVVHINILFLMETLQSALIYLFGQLLIQDMQRKDLILIHLKLIRYKKIIITFLFQIVGKLLLLVNIIKSKMIRI